MKRPERENYDIGKYGDIDYQNRLEKYCTYLENKNLENYMLHDIENYLETIGYSIIKTRLEIKTKQLLSMLTTKTL
jgi:uncharacterized protein YlbG (UPF0298 family)